MDSAKIRTLENQIRFPYPICSGTQPCCIPSFASPLSKDGHWMYSVPTEAVCPEYPWPKSLCFAASICPVSNNNLADLATAETCPIAPFNGCPLFYACAESFESYGELNNVEIFEAGQEASDNFTEDDLNIIVNNFNSLYNIQRVPLVIGHSEDQKYLNQEGLPSCGWVTSVKKKGKKLFASFSDVPAKIGKLINNKAFRFVSSEIYPHFVFQETNWGKVLRRIVILGADIPKIKGLAEISGLYTASENKNSDPTNSFKSYFLKMAEEQIKGGSGMKNLEELRAELAENIAKLASKETEYSTNPSDETKVMIESIKTAISELKSEIRTSEAEPYPKPENVDTYPTPPTVSKESFNEPIPGQIEKDPIKLGAETPETLEISPEIIPMPDPAVATQSLAFAELQTTFNDQIKILRERCESLESKNKKMQANFSAQELKTHLSDIDQFCENLAQNGMSPAVIREGTTNIKSYVSTLDWKKPLHYAEGEISESSFEQATTLFNLLVDRFSENKLFIPREELPKEEPDDNMIPEVDGDLAKLDAEIKHYAEEQNVDYNTAYSVIIKRKRASGIEY